MPAASASRAATNNLSLFIGIGENLLFFAIRLGTDNHRAFLALGAVARRDRLTLGPHPIKNVAAVLVGEI